HPDAATFPPPRPPTPQERPPASAQANIAASLCPLRRFARSTGGISVRPSHLIPHRHDADNPLACRTADPSAAPRERSLVAAWIRPPGRCITNSGTTNDQV